METIGINYKMLRDKSTELGKGAFSIVYGGLYTGPNQDYIKKDTKVAIKVIQKHNLTKKALDILEDEISIMKLIKENPHPNIVHCYDVIRSSNEIYIIMEYCDSGDLMTIIKRPIKEKYAQFYFCQLSNGLKYLDAHNIIHRDIKPRNILLTNNRRVLKIADFGLAKRIHDVSLHETICGSPLYMAPEIMNHKSYNNQTDLWSIGMILFEMLYGSHPFEKCKSVPELKDHLKKIHIQIPPINTQNKDVSTHCINLLQNLLQKKVTDRINWENFFSHPWVIGYKYDSGRTNINETERYEKQLYSVSFGSLPENSPLIKNVPNKFKKVISSSSIPIIKTQTNELVIIDDFYDKVCRGSSPNDNCMFDFEEDEKSNDSRKMRDLIDKSSILEEDTGDYSIIE
jgi:serine/threonine protein kinase